MGRILTSEDETLRPHLIEYDRNNPSSKIPSDLIRYIESLQDGFSEAELAWIRDYEYFIFNIYSPKGLIARAIPGLRIKKGVETQYIMRYSTDNYRSMMNEFLAYTSPDLPEDLADYCNMPVHRVMLPNGNKFYPINYHKDIPAWRKLISESAKFHGTMTGRFENGKFLLSDGQKINFSDLALASLVGREPYPSDW